MARGGPSSLLFTLRNVLNHRITVLCVTALLACYVLWQAGSLVWKLWLLNDSSPQTEVLFTPPPDSTEMEPLQDLLRYPLIQSGPDPATMGTAPVDTPKTSLNLKLVGLMYSRDKNQARAIIVSDEDGARSYSTHERVADKAEIYSIEPDRVILLHAGQQEALMLDPEDKTSGTPSNAGSQSLDDPDNNAVSAEALSASGRNSANAPRKMADLMRDFSATPVMEEGELVGFRLKAVRDPELMNEWGIDPSDVITAVNGIPLDSQRKIMVLYDKLKKQKEFDLTLHAGGDSRTITVDLTE